MSTQTTHYTIVWDPELIDEQFGALSPFNLKRDLKGLDVEERKELGRQIQFHLETEEDRTIVLFKSQINILIFLTKIRCSDQKHKRGKSGGFRCIVLVDKANYLSFLLHVFPKTEKDNINQSQKNQLKKLTNQYAIDMQNYKKV